MYRRLSVHTFLHIIAVTLLSHLMSHLMFAAAMHADVAATIQALAWSCYLHMYIDNVKADAQITHVANCVILKVFHGMRSLHLFMPTAHGMRQQLIHSQSCQSWLHTTNKLAHSRRVLPFLQKDFMGV